jgi:hypothetical protein
MTASYGTGRKKCGGGRGPPSKAAVRAVPACVILATFLFMHEAAEEVRLPNENELIVVQHRRT